MTETLYTTSEVAALLRIHRQHVYVLIKQGRLGCVRFGRSLRFTGEQVEACIKEASALAPRDQVQPVVRLRRSPRR